MVRLLMRQDHIHVEDARRLFVDVAAKLRRHAGQRSVVASVPCSNRPLSPACS
jgi:hypothetical protein